MVYFYSVEILDDQSGVIMFANHGSCEAKEIRSLDDFDKLQKELTEMKLNEASEISGIPKENLYVKFIAFNRI